MFARLKRRMPPPLFKLWARRDIPGAPFIVCAMFSKGYQEKAERLLASLLPLRLEYAIYEVPAVHRSVSLKGVDDLSLSKPQIIAFALDQFKKPVLYVDADTCFRGMPALFTSLRDDFAIYNWLAGDCTDAWVPVPGQKVLPGTPPRYWTFSHAIDDWSQTQLICSGCVQWWAPSARTLLDRWYDVIAAHPRAQDDHCLDVAFNYRPPDNLRFTWLSKQYGRYAFWIFDEPVIDHPEFPAPASGGFDSIPGGRAIVSQITMNAGKRVPVPRTMMIDAHDKVLLAKNMAGAFVPAAPLQARLYLPPE